MINSRNVKPALPFFSQTELYVKFFEVMLLVCRFFQGKNMIWLMGRKKWLLVKENQSSPLPTNLTVYVFKMCSDKLDSILVLFYQFFCYLSLTWQVFCEWICKFYPVNCRIRYEKKICTFEVLYFTLGIIGLPQPVKCNGS